MMGQAVIGVALEFEVVGIAGAVARPLCNVVGLRERGIGPAVGAAAVSDDEVEPLIDGCKPPAAVLDGDLARRERVGRHGELGQGAGRSGISLRAPGRSVHHGASLGRGIEAAVAECVELCHHGEAPLGGVGFESMQIAEQPP